MHYVDRLLHLLHILRVILSCQSRCRIVLAHAHTEINRIRHPPPTPLKNMMKKLKTELGKILWHHSRNHISHHTQRQRRRAYAYSIVCEACSVHTRKERLRGLRGCAPININHFLFINSCLAYILWFSSHIFHGTFVLCDWNILFIRFVCARIRTHVLSHIHIHTNNKYNNVNDACLVFVRL